MPLEPSEESEHLQPPALIQRYAQITTKLIDKSGQLSSRRLLECFCLRDAVEKLIRNSELALSAVSVDQLVAADTSLRNLSSHVAPLAELRIWRQAIAPSPEAWWWFPEREKSGRWKAWSLFLGCLTAALVTEIAGRFGRDNIDLLGGALVTFPAVLAALTAGGALSNTIESSIRSWLLSWGVPQHRQPVFLTWAAALIFLGALSIWLGMPRISRFYNDRGAASIRADRPAEAETYLQRALRLDPENPHAHYNLGDLHERLERRKEAIHEYGLAAVGGLDLAANNLGRLLILEGRPDDAVQIMLPLERRTRAQSVERNVRYHILKNLAWARIVQGRFAEAVEPLEEARTLLPNAAPAHCLLGQAYRKLGDQARSSESWTNCLATARELNPDEDRWISEADRFFQETDL